MIEKKIYGLYEYYLIVSKNGSIQIAPEKPNKRPHDGFEDTRIFGVSGKITVRELSQWQTLNYIGTFENISELFYSDEKYSFVDMD